MRVRKTYIVLSFRTTLQAMEYPRAAVLHGGCCRKSLSNGSTGWMQPGMTVQQRWNNKSKTGE